MPKRPPRSKLFEWRVIQLKATPARLIGYFKGASADDAIKRAIVEREISDPLTQSRLAAQQVREIGKGAYAHDVPEYRRQLLVEMDDYRRKKA